MASFACPTRQKDWCVAVCCGVLRFVAVCYSVLQCVAVCPIAGKTGALQCVAVCCGAWQVWCKCDAVCCSML